MSIHTDSLLHAAKQYGEALEQGDPKRVGDATLALLVTARAYFVTLPGLKPCKGKPGEVQARLSSTPGGEILTSIRAGDFVYIVFEDPEHAKCGVVSEGATVHSLQDPHGIAEGGGWFWVLERKKDGWHATPWGRSLRDDLSLPLK